MRLSTLRTPSLLLSWALAPPMVVQSDTGQVRFAIGGAVGQYEVVTRDCEGRAISSRPVEFDSYGAKVDWLPPRHPFRVSAFGGVSSVAGTEFDADGPHGGAVVAFEGRRIGIGVGPVWLPGHDIVPSIYLRLGDRPDNFRIDVFAPTATRGSNGDFRMGAEFGRPRLRGFVGLSSHRFADDRADGTGAFADLGFVLRSDLDLTVSGSWHGGGKDHSDWAVAIGAQYHMRYGGSRRD
ncbi:MAG: hypothetical protein R3246_16485 [Acidimicrobiia bacterium]|nr:hypothetical protein [Acidimicrobiia bacterium]